MSSRLTRSGAREHDRKKRSGRSGWRMLMWPNESTMPSFASTWFAVTRSSSRSSSFAIGGLLPDEFSVGCHDGTVGLAEEGNQAKPCEVMRAHGEFPETHIQASGHGRDAALPVIVLCEFGHS